MKKYFKTNRQINKINLVEMVSPDKILKSTSSVLRPSPRYKMNGRRGRRFYRIAILISRLIPARIDHADRA